MAEEKENLIKKVCKELNVTYKQLSEKIGVSEGSLHNVSSTGKMSKQLEKSLELLLDNQAMKKDFEVISQFKELLHK